MAVLLLAAWLAVPAEAPAAGRWVSHIVISAPPAGTVGRPVDTLSVPETAGHWVWLVWYDLTAGQWQYNLQNPYAFSNGTVAFQVPDWNRWYYLLIFDTVSGVYY